MSDETTSSGPDTSTRPATPVTPGTPTTTGDPESGRPAPGTSGSFDVNQPTIISLCYLGGWVTGGLSGIVGLVLAMIWQKENKDAWADSHFTYHARTFWFALAAGVVGFILTFFVIGIFLLMAVPVYVTVRAIMSMLKAQKHEPMPDPQTLLF